MVDSTANGGSGQSDREGGSPDNAGAPPTAIPDPEPSVGWIGALLLALRFLLPLGEPMHADARSWRRAAYWFLPLGLVIGMLWVGVFRAVWRLYGEEVTSLRLVPAGAVLVVDVLLTGYCLFTGLTATIHALTGRRHAREPESEEVASPSLPAITVLFLTIIIELVLLSALRTGAWWWPGDWRRHLNFAYPRLIYRPLLLAPLWGRWAILLAASVGRTASRCHPSAVGLSRAVSPSMVLGFFLVPLVFTAVYCSRSGNVIIGTIIALTVLGLTFVSSVVMARRGGGQTRRSMLAAGKIAELIFLGVFIGMSGYIRGW
jgi:hypothetical protein